MINDWDLLDEMLRISELCKAPAGTMTVPITELEFWLTVMTELVEPNVVLLK